MDNNNQFNDYTVIDSQANARPIAKTFMANVFLWMFAALGLSALFSLLFANSPELLSYLLSVNAKGQVAPNMLGYATIFAPIGFVLLLRFGQRRLSATTMVVLFLAFAAIIGISFSFILLQYTASSVLGVFVSASAMFGIMAVMGYTTDKDLTSFGRILTMGLIGIVIAMLVNFFLHSTMLEYIISIVGVAVFIGLTAYDVQKLKHIGMGIQADGTFEASSVKKMAILGALTLYLDFINLFLMLLRLFGRRD